MDLARWLQQLGLEQYESAFRANAIDDAVLPKLTADDLKDLGVALVGHRRKLLDAIARLPAGLEPAQPKVPIMPTGAERRHLTVMFCDLVGSTALSGYLDPEDLRQLLGAYHATVKAEIERFGGFIAKYMGDGVLIYFGYPQAHEDDAERAIRAGLALLERVSHIDSGPEKLSVRIGIATGLVVVGDLIGTGEAQERGIVGETPNVAARLQALAEPNTVLIGAITRSLVGDLFEYRDLGAIKLRGVSEPVPVWQVLRPSAVESRFDALHTRALLPLVGRDEEINLILRRWGRAKAGEGQVVLISGEAGVGKSRIVAAFTERLHGESHHRLRYFCSPYYQASALHPFIEHLGRAAGFAPDDPAASRLEKLNAVLVRAMPPETDLAFIADLLSLPAIIPDQLPNLSAQQKKNRTLQALLGQLDGLARRQPTVIFFEDAHWADPTSCELLDLMVERIGSLPVMLIVTFRPEFRAPWIGHPHVSMLALNRLSRRDRIAMIIQVTGGKALPRNIVDQIADRTDGVPLFIEELTKSVLESGLLRETQDGVYAFDAALPPLAIPTTLHASLLERLDRLASVRRVAQIGAAIGREFSYSMLRAIAPLPEQELKADLERLVGSELVFQRGEPPDAMYIFKHALVQDAAHSSLLRSTRQQLHARIAEALEAHFPELMDSQPELFAQHYAEAGLVQQSVASWAKAGRRSVGRSSMAEAAAQFQKSLDQLVLLPDGRERQKQELELRAALGAVLQAVKGLAAPETSHAYDRAYELWEKLDCPSEFLQVPFGRALHHLMRCEFDRALSLADNLLHLSFQHNDTVGTILGHLSRGRVLQNMGRIVQSRAHLEDALALYDPALHNSIVSQIGVHPHVNAQGILAWVLFFLGFPDQAKEASNAAIAKARRLSHSPSLGHSLGLSAGLHIMAGISTGFSTLIDELVALATEQDFPYWRALGEMYRGWIKVTQGDLDEGVLLLRDGAIAHRAAGAEVWAPINFSLLAAAYKRAGQIEESLAVLDEALRIVESAGGHFMAAELNRRKGHILLRQGYAEMAEELFRKALIMAREQGIRAWELRTTTSLARLRSDQRRRAEARDLLQPIYELFTEGFNTSDLKDAKAVLNSLA